SGFSKRFSGNSSPCSILNGYVPDDYEVGIMIAIGYQDSHEILPERFKEKADLPRERKPLSEIAFLEKIGNGII
ncbi:MAG: hypothetical protein R3321_13835, partial [Nitrososphaeraceae archaeon]|nr:hypothetical protein [Nitrososphaeraceae archaeon]